MKKKSAQRRSFTREFKLEAVRQVIEQNRKISEVSRELGIGAGMLGQWKQHLLADREEAFRGKGRLKVADEELRRLERENRQLRMEVEFLKNSRARRGRPPARRETPDERSIVSREEWPSAFWCLANP